MNILFCGDFAPCFNYKNLIMEKRTGVFGELISPLQNADISFLNLETPLTHSNNIINKSGPAIKADPICADIIAEAGFSIAGLANNHILDYREEGLIDTLTYLHNACIKTVGAGLNLEDAIKPIYIKVNNIKVAIIAVAEHEFSIASSNKAGAAPLDMMELTEQIEDAKKTCQLVFVTIHGSNEYFPYPRPGLRKLCQYLIRRGSHGVICHHSHVPGVYELYEQKPIFYGLGNLIFDFPGKKANIGWAKGYAVSLIYDEHSAFKGYKIIPYTQSVAQGGITTMTGYDKEQFLLELESMSRKLAIEEDYYKEWENFCKYKELNILLRLFVHSKFRGASRLHRWAPIIKKLISKKSFATKLNLIRCESHREIVINILEDQL